jgi:hypothetical protein
MKPKNKMIALLEIAVVLCSLFLVSVPAITAASAIYEPGPLDVYGNANEDDTIDMRDLTYVKLIFFGKKPETELADAKYDGKINPLDFIQIKLIIVGKERELTYIDILGELVQWTWLLLLGPIGQHTRLFFLRSASCLLLELSLTVTSRRYSA